MDFVEFEINVVGGHLLRLLRRNLESDDVVDPNFFDANYSVMAATGFQVWEGAWLLKEYLELPEIRQGLRGVAAVELGAGTGAAGLVAATLGADVLLTDLRQVVEGVLVPNIARSSVTNPYHVGLTSSARRVWKGAVEVGSGSAVAAALDWESPITDDGCINDPRKAELVLAADTAALQVFFFSIALLAHFFAALEFSSQNI